MSVGSSTEEEYAKAYFINGIHVLIDAKSALYLAGATVDYIQTFEQSGFKIINPNAKTTCGCGSSFS
jgi:iron-sulfur cluster assembly protein